jgi:hypothetical protein
MVFRRRWELVLVVAVCATVGWMSRSATAPSVGKLQELLYLDWPFQYSLRVKPDGSAEYNASLNCVGATPEPGQLGCQHMNGDLSAKEVGQLWSELSATHPENFLTPKSPTRGPGAGRSLDLKFDGKSACIKDSRQSDLAFDAINRLHPGAIHKQLESKRTAEEKALKQR